MFFTMVHAVAHKDARTNNNNNNDYLSIRQVSELRVRELKRRLALHHGYGNDELSRILDKKELIQLLAFEEEQLRLKMQATQQRETMWQGIFTAVIAILVVLFWPLLRRAYEVAQINFVVYTDRKRLEFRKCREYASLTATVFVLAKLILDVLQLWLTLSILLSWIVSVMTVVDSETWKHYMFPVPHWPLRPGQLLFQDAGNNSSSSKFSNFGINMGPMVISYSLQWLRVRLENWTGKAWARAAKSRRTPSTARTTTNGTDEARQSRRAAREARKRAAQEQHSRQQQELSGSLPPEWMMPNESITTTTTTTTNSNANHDITTSGTMTEDAFWKEVQEYKEEVVVAMTDNDDDPSSSLQDLD